jgi:hypothetical protein
VGIEVALLLFFLHVPLTVWWQGIERCTDCRGVNDNGYLSRYVSGTSGLPRGLCFFYTQIDCLPDVRRHVASLCQASLFQRVDRVSTKGSASCEAAMFGLFLNQPGPPRGSSGFVLGIA